MRYELLAHGIRVKLVEPGGVRTRFSHPWHLHEAYEPLQSRVRERMASAGPTLPGPEVVAPVIFRAATDGTRRLRYPAAGGGPFMLLGRLLPEEALRRLVTHTFTSKTQPARELGDAR